MASDPTEAESDRASSLRRRGLQLEYATLGWNATELLILAVAAVEARSVSLAGFALDSLIEIFASAVAVRELKGTIDEARERTSLAMIGVAFFLLALYIAAQSAVSLALGIRPESSTLGIVWLSATCVAMFSLAGGKAWVGRQLQHSVLSAEAKVTRIDGLLAAGILSGLLLNALLGWWWADIAAGGILIMYGLREGVHHVRAGTRARSTGSGA